MAVSQRHQSESDDDSETIDLKDDLGLNLPPTEVEVEFVPHSNSRTIYVTRGYKWTIEGTVTDGECSDEVTAVYDPDTGKVAPLPERVPPWLRRVCQYYGIDELAI